MVVGADTARGRAIIDRLVDPAREVRAFVSDARVAEQLKTRGVKVALGDVTDESHVAGACLNCFSVVFVDEACTDERERSFASDIAAIRRVWAAAAGQAGVQRVIWVTTAAPPPVDAAESAVADPRSPDVADEVFRLDDARQLDV